MLSQNTPAATSETPFQGQGEAVTVERGDGGAGLVFWWLITMSVGCIAPCLVLPAWREYQEAELKRRIRAGEVAAATRHVERLQRRLDAVHNDPAVVARLARRELAYRGSEELVVAVAEPVQTADEWALAPAEVERRPVEPPVAIRRLTALLPAIDYDALFCHSPERETVLGMSVGLFAGAFLIFWPKYSQRVH